MPPDIRSFFGGKPAAPSSQEKPSEKKTTPKGRGRSRKVLDDSDDEATNASPKKSTPKKPAAKKREATPDGETTTTQDYFGGKKPRKAASTKIPGAELKITPKPSPAKSTASTGRSSGRKRKAVDYTNGVGDDEDDNDGVMKHAEDDDEKDDVFTAEYQKKDDYEEDDDMLDVEDLKPAKDKKTTPKAGRKRKSEAAENEDASPVKKARAPRKTKPKEEVQESAEAQAIFDSIPLVRPPTPPSTKKNFDFKAGHANSGPPPGAGTKEIPEGAENCLAGLTFVFTGLLETVSRDDGQALVKRYGGKCMSAPSGKTSYVVLGSDAGPKKLETIQKHGLKTINEDGLFELIRRLPANGGDSKAAAAHDAKKQAEEERVKEAAAQQEREEKAAREKELKAQKAKASTSGQQGPAQVGGARANDKAPISGPDARLWTVKYAPNQLSQVCGNKGAVEKLQRWLRNFPKSQKTKFKLAGPDGSGVYRAVMIHGPPGIGKTTAAHLVAKLEGYDIVESNASDTRSKKLVEAGLRGVLSTTSLLGYFAGDGAQVEASKKKLVLIMDEVDGMSAGDRGGVGALAAVCKKSQIPMILICNDRRQPKMKPFDHVTYDLTFRRPSADMIRSRIMTIAFREKIKVPPNVVDALVEGTHADIRQVVNMLSTAKLDEELNGHGMNFDSSKEMSKAWQKHVILKPWDIVSKILGGGMFSSSSKATINDKAELYFNDHERSSLMLEENYLGTNPIRAANYHGREKNLKHLELASEAADSISDGDLADRMIHGSEQHWSLMPTHAILSFVRPASFVSGSQAGSQTRFTAWLGHNSSYSRMSRVVKEIQGHMRLRSSGDRHEIRMQYMPLLWASLVKRLAVEGKDVVPEIIELMDGYFLTKDDWDGILELGVGYMDQEHVKIDSATKATFTRLYNQASHPMPFMKASSVVAPKKQAKVKPDLEEALDESDEAEFMDEDEAKDEEDAEDADLSKDKYVKQPKKKKAPAAKGKAKKKAAADEDDDDEGEEEKPKRGKGKAKAKK